MRPILIICAFLMGTLGISAQEEMFFKAMESSEIAKIIDLMDSRVELCIEDSQELYTRREAIRRIQAWLREVKPKKLESLHGGESVNNQSHYKVGKLTTDTGAFRVFVYIEDVNSSPRIKKIQIDKF